LTLPTGLQSDYERRTKTHREAVTAQCSNDKIVAISAAEREAAARIDAMREEQAKVRV
jgi:predicted GIY-YIG superfamily endonuclease